MTRRSLEGDGRRARLGIVVPSVNTVMEPWAQRTVPEGVSVLAARMIEEPVENSSDNFTKPNWGLAQRINSSASRERCRLHWAAAPR